MAGRDEVPEPRAGPRPPPSCTRWATEAPQQLPSSGLPRPAPPCSLPHQRGQPWGCSGARGGGLGGRWALGRPQGGGPAAPPCPSQRFWPEGWAAGPQTGTEGLCPQALPAGLLREGQCCLSCWGAPGSLLTPQQACLESWSRSRPAWPWALTPPGRDGHLQLRPDTTRAGVHSCYDGPSSAGPGAACCWGVPAGHRAPDSHRPPSRGPESLLAWPSAARAGRHQLSWCSPASRGDRPQALAHLRLRGGHEPVPQQQIHPRPQAPAEPPTQAAWPPGAAAQEPRAGRQADPAGASNAVPTWLAPRLRLLTAALPPPGPEEAAPVSQEGLRRNKGTRGQDVPSGCRGSHRTEGVVSPCGSSQPLCSLHLWGQRAALCFLGRCPSRPPPCPEARRGQSGGGC